MITSSNARSTFGKKELVGKKEPAVEAHIPRGSLVELRS
jgi:hypothetical protein